MKRKEGPSDVKKGAKWGGKNTSRSRKLEKREKGRKMEISNERLQDRGLFGFLPEEREKRKGRSKSARCKGSKAWIEIRASMGPSSSGKGFDRGRRRKP